MRYFDKDSYTLENILMTSKCILFSYLAKNWQVWFLHQMSLNVSPNEEEEKCSMYFNEL